MLPKLLLCHITKEEKIAVEEEKRWRIVKKKTKTMSMKKRQKKEKERETRPTPISRVRDINFCFLLINCVSFK